MIFETSSLAIAVIVFNSDAQTLVLILTAWLMFCRTTDTDMNGATIPKLAQALVASNTRMLRGRMAGYIQRGWSIGVIVQIGPLVAPRGYGSAKDCSLDHCFTPGALISSRSVWFSCLTTSLLRCNTSLGLLDFRSHWFLLKG